MELAILTKEIDRLISCFALDMNRYWREGHGVRFNTDSKTVRYPTDCIIEIASDDISTRSTVS